MAVVVAGGKEYHEKKELGTLDLKDTGDKGFLNDIMGESELRYWESFINELLIPQYARFSYLFNWYNEKKFFSHTDNLTLINNLLGMYIKRGIIVPSPVEVKKYLLEYTDLIFALALVLDNALDFVMEPERILLDVYEDPEENNKYLTLDITYDCFEEKIIEDIENINKAYYPFIRKSDGRIVVTPIIQEKHTLGERRMGSG